MHEAAWRGKQKTRNGAPCGFRGLSCLMLCYVADTPSARAGMQQQHMQTAIGEVLIDTWLYASISKQSIAER
jgi:hypothetical protein